MVNCSNVTAGIKAVGNYITNNPKKVAAAVVTAGLVAAGVYYRAELNELAPVAYEKTTEFAKTTFTQVRENASAASNSLHEKIVAFARSNINPTTSFGNFVHNYVVNFAGCQISPADTQASTVWYDDAQAALVGNCTL